MNPKERRQQLLARRLRTSAGAERVSLALNYHDAERHLAAVHPPALLADLFPATSLDFASQLFTGAVIFPHPQLCLLTGPPFSGKSDAAGWLSSYLTYSFQLIEFPKKVRILSWDGVKDDLKASGQPGLLRPDGRYTLVGLRAANELLFRKASAAIQDPLLGVLVIDTPAYYARQRTHALPALIRAVHLYHRKNSHHMELFAGLVLSQEILGRREEPKAAPDLYTAAQGLMGLGAKPAISDSDLAQLTVGANKMMRDNSVTEAVSWLTHPDNPHPRSRYWHTRLTDLAARPPHRLTQAKLLTEAWIRFHNTPKPLPSESDVNHWAELVYIHLPALAMANLDMVRAGNQFVGYNEKI